MSTITTRSGKGSPLTNNEVDANFTNLNTDKLESADLAGYATLSGATFTGEVEATGFNGDLTGAILFKGQAGEALTKGDPVYISGISGNKTVVSKADANDANKMPCFGIVDATVSANADCSVVTFGTLQGLDTSSFSEGDELFVSDTGTLTTTAPTGESSQLQKIGKVTRSHASTGSIKVMGAGRTNAVPNLNDGQFFLGNGSNQAVSTDFTTSVLGEISAGTGIGISGSGVISNSAPDQTVSLTGAGTTTVSGTYPNFTITGAGTTYTAGSGLSLTGTEFANTSPDQTVSLTGAGTTTVTGTYPNFTITGAGTTYTAGTGLTLTGAEFSLTNSTSYMLNNADNDTVAYTNKTRFHSNTDGGTASGHMSGLEVYQATVNADAFMSFHVQSGYAGYFGLDKSTNDLFWGGWSNGAVKNKVFHAGNVPSSGNWFSGTAPVIGTDGVMEVGKYIDFHAATNHTTDNTIRLEESSNPDGAALMLRGNLYLNNGATDGAKLFLSTNVGSSYSINNNGTSLVFKDGSTETMRLNYQDRLGLGTSAPAQKLHVVGSIVATGNITAYYSDERLKDFKGKINNPLEKINTLNGYYFKPNETALIAGAEQNGLEVGVSAQEVEKVLPEIVSPSALGKDYKTVSYEKLTPLLIEAVKELSAKVDNLELRLQNLEK
jgi:hypothetical protein